MPGKFQSEYMRNFKWSNRPIRFKQPMASLDARAPGMPRRAGLASSSIGIHREPALQERHRAPSPPVSSGVPADSKQFRSNRSVSNHDHHRHRHSSKTGGLTLSASGSAMGHHDPVYRPVPPVVNSARSDDAPPAGKPTWKRPFDPAAAIADDFILLGSQQKFAPNVAYRMRKPVDPSRFSKQLSPQPKTAQRVPQMTDDNTQTANAEVPAPPIPRFHTADENIQVNEMELSNEVADSPTVTPDAPRREKTPEPLNVVTEGVQTDADDHYAVRRRLGLVSRVNAGRFQTEYGRQYNPSHSVSAPAFRRIYQKQQPETPIMNAEQMFRRSRSRSPVSAAPSVLLQTEYDRSFRPYQWQLHQRPDGKRRSLSAEGHEVLYDAKVMPRSPSVSDDNRPHRRHHHHHLHHQRHHSNEGKTDQVARMKALKWPKRYLSEYASNFRQPSAFHYENGTWKGVAQPHLTLESAPPTAVVVGDPSWLSEVRELKSRAKEYNLRNKATHFSSKHVGQLYSEKANLWDQAGGDGGTRLAMLDVPVQQPSLPIVSHDATVHAVVDDSVQVDTLPAPEDLIRPAGLPTVRRGTVQTSLEWAVASATSSEAASCSTESCHSEGECTDSMEEAAVVQAQPPPVEPQPQPPVRPTQAAAANRLVVVKTDRSQGSTISSSSCDSGIIPTAAGGRVRTSRMVSLQTRGNGSPRRHHLDVTTPAVGGAILTSPPMPILAEDFGKKSRSTSGKGCDTANESMASSKHHHHLHHHCGGMSSGYSSTANSRPRSPAVSGKPTYDSHVIVERDKPLRLHYSKSSNIKGADASRSGTVEQLVLDRSRENTPANESAGTKKTAMKKQPFSATQTKAKAATGLTIAIPQRPTKSSKTMTIAQHIQDHRDLQNRSPTSSQASSVSVASDVLEKAKARANFWDKSVSARL